MVPFFTVVIPSYNRASRISKILHSLITQTYLDFEIVFVDDGSTDRTEEVVLNLNDQRVRYLKQSNKERGAARNTGIKAARGSYITFFDSDDLAYPHHLETAYAFIQSNGFPDIFHVGYEVINDLGKLLRKADRLKNINQIIKKGNPLSCIGVFVKKEVIVNNLFNEDRVIAGLEDWELWLRLSNRYRILACNTVTSALVQHMARSVLQATPENLERKERKFCEYVLKHEGVQFYRRDVLAGIKTYTALHLAISRAPKRDIWKYFLKGILMNPAELWRKRSLVIMKMLILN